MTAAPTTLASLSPRALARLTGLLYLITVAAGVIAQGVIGGQLIVPGNAALTARSIVEHESLYRLGFTIYLVEMAAQVGMTVLFYRLLAPAGRTIALGAAALGLTGCVIKTMSRLFYLAPLAVLAPSAALAGGFDPAQRESLAMLLLELNDLGAGIALPFFGLSGILMGWLVIRSDFLPRFLGVIKVAGGLGWLTFVSPSLGMRLFPLVAGLGILGAIVTILWLLIKGVDEGRWRARDLARQPG